MLTFFTDYYFVVLILQAFCAIHCMRKGNQQKWIWLIVFLPLVGCVAYIFTEMVSRREVGHVQSGISSLFNPSGKIRRLQKQLDFRDTFDNRIALADALLETGQAQSAANLYEKSLTGNFTDHEHGNIQLMKSYAALHRYEDIVIVGKRIYKLPQFARSKAHLLYAIALGNMGDTAGAEQEFSLLKGKFSNYESRYYYGKFLMDNNRNDEARKLLNELIGEFSFLDSGEKRSAGEWINKAKAELKKIPV